MSVSQQEREEAEKTFGSGQAEALLAEEASISKTFEPGEGIAAAEAASEQGKLLQWLIINWFNFGVFRIVRFS